MHNVIHEVVDHKLVLTIDISPAAIAAAIPSSTGKTTLIATSSGPVSFYGPAGARLSFSINVMNMA